MDTLANEPVIHSFSSKNTTSLVSPLVVIAVLVAILLGIFSGYFLAGNVHKTNVTFGTGSNSGQVAGGVSKGQVFGSSDTSAFKDSAEGVLANGGIKSEGQYHLVRPGGESQYVYLTSSTVDLSQFMNHKIKVWGQTQKAQYAGWLMDVGRIQVEE